MIWCILCFIFGFKRIGLAGIVVVVLLLLIINKPLKGIAAPLIRIETICAIVICFIFVYMILDDSLLHFFCKRELQIMDEVLFIAIFAQFVTLVLVI